VRRPRPGHASARDSCAASAVAPQQVAMDGGDGKALGGVGVPLGVVQHLLVGPALGRCTRGGQPVHADRLAGCGHLRKPLAKVVQAGDEGPVGLAEAEGGQQAQQQVQAVADLGLARCRPCGRRAGTTTRPATPRRPRPGGPPTAAAGCRPGQADAVAASRRGDRPARPARLRTATSAGSMTRGPDLRAGVRTLPMVWSRQSPGAQSSTDTLTGTGANRLKIEVRLPATWSPLTTGSGRSDEGMSRPGDASGGSAGCRPRPPQ
jgi:hypothetical protein